jgi:hypothetical protein
MYKLIVKITNKKGNNETVINDFKTVEDARKNVEELYDFAKENIGKKYLSVSRNNWTEWNERHFISMTIYNADGNDLAIVFTVEKQ